MKRIVNNFLYVLLNIGKYFLPAIFFTLILILKYFKIDIQSPFSYILLLMIPVGLNITIYNTFKDTVFKLSLKHFISIFLISSVLIIFFVIVDNTFSFSSFSLKLVYILLFSPLIYFGLIVIGGCSFFLFFSIWGVISLFHRDSEWSWFNEEGKLYRFFNNLLRPLELKFDDSFLASLLKIFLILFLAIVFGIIGILIVTLSSKLINILI
ncbi:hypothetical protein JW948_04255 [bacterium]|nr:hypothetical protein [bacterium]